jgi:hypothetical protein
MDSKMKLLVTHLVILKCPMNSEGNHPNTLDLCQEIYAVRRFGGYWVYLLSVNAGSMPCYQAGF